MVSAVAPHSPTFAGSPSFFEGGTRHGPIEQFLQQLPSAPMGQGFMVSARSNTVEMLCLRAWSMIVCDASQTVKTFSCFISFTSFISFASFLVTFFSAIMSTSNGKFLISKFETNQNFKKACLGFSA
jgi:hypothetical protein